MAGTITASIVKNDTTSPTQFQNSAGTEIGQLSRAWVNFNGTTSPGTIRASFNVSSVTRAAAGDYVVNFTNAFSDANYATVSSSGRNGTGAGGYLSLVSDRLAQTTSAVQIYTINIGGATLDSPYVTVSVFR